MVVVEYKQEQNATLLGITLRGMDNMGFSSMTCQTQLFAKII